MAKVQQRIHGDADFRLRDTRSIWLGLLPLLSMASYLPRPRSSPPPAPTHLPLQVPADAPGPCAGFPGKEGQAAKDPGRRLAGHRRRCPPSTVAALGAAQGRRPEPHTVPASAPAGASPRPGGTQQRCPHMPEVGRTAWRPAFPREQFPSGKVRVAPLPAIDASTYLIA